MDHDTTLKILYIGKKTKKSTSVNYLIYRLFLMSTLKEIKEILYIFWPLDFVPENFLI